MVVKGMLLKMTGQPVFIPLLKEIYIMMLRKNIRFRTFYIDTKENDLADPLSRGPSEQGKFDRALSSWRDSRFVSTDRDDWQFSPEEVCQLDREFGPFQVDATSDETGSNAHFAKFWHAKDDCRLHDWAGLNVWCNLPFSIMLSIILHFIKSKLRSPLGTSATFVVPAWLGHDALRLIIEMPAWFRRIRTFPTGSEIFTSQSASSLGEGRRHCGPTKWPVWVVHVPPTFLSLDSVPGWVQSLLD